MVTRHYSAPPKLFGKTNRKTPRVLPFVLHLLTFTLGDVNVVFTESEHDVQDPRF